MKKRNTDSLKRQLKSPILDKLDKMRREKHISFHTPGHKSKNALIDWGDYVPYCDLTEIEGLDNLHEPRGIIRESQEEMARIFGARKTIYSVNGTTGGLYMAMGSLTRPGDRVLIQRNSHKAVYNACILNRLEPVYLDSNIEDNIVQPIDPDQLEERLREDESIVLVLVTSPSYYGLMADMERIVSIVRKYNRYLIVDEAHGSHLVFSHRLPASSLSHGADIVVQSSHKTLPSLTQTSMVHVGSDRVDLGRLEEFSKLYQTTSPSYLFMLSLETAANYMEREGRKSLEDNLSRIDYWMDRLATHKTISIYDREGRDRTKLVFSIEGYTGGELEEIYREAGIYLEMSDPYYALALVTAMNSLDEIDALFLKMLELGEKSRPIRTIDSRTYSRGEVVYPIYEAFYMDSYEEDLDRSLGKVSKSFVIPYPPGVPILVPGERIDGEIIGDIKLLLEDGVDFIGLRSGSLELIRED